MWIMASPFVLIVVFTALVMIWVQNTANRILKNKNQ